MRSEVNNRRLFKKATQARDKLREMGGIATMPQPQVMDQAPKQPMAGGIMASSPELMQASALPRPVVLPRSNQPAPMPMPMAQGQAPMLPPSQPIPNIAGIQQMNRPMAQAPRPMAQKPPVKKLAGGGPPIADTTKSYEERLSTIDFGKAFKFGQKAVTTEGAAELGVPAEAADLMKKDLAGKPEDVSKEIIESELPEENKTGDTKTDLIAAATNLGIESVPAEAEIDEINKAIAGAKLGAALAGNYVNPNTGQAIRPTAGARISSAVADSLMVSRDTETRRAEQEAALAKANIAARAKNDGSWWESGEGKFYRDTVKNYAMSGRKSLPEVHKEFAIQYPGIAQKALTLGLGTNPDIPGEEPPSTDTSTRNVEPSANEGIRFKDKGPGNYIDDATGKAFEVTEEGVFFIGTLNPDTGKVKRETRVKID